MQFIIIAVTLCCATTFTTAIDKVNHELHVAANTDSKAVITCSYPEQQIPDPYDCTAYYHCGTDYVPQHRYCAAGESFSQYSLICIPYAPDQCANTVTSPTAPPTIHPVSCAYASEVLPHPYDCASYYICNVALSPIPHYCAPNLYYDPAYAGCNIINRVSCSGGYRPTPIPTAYPAPSGVGPQPTCNLPGDIYANYYDCAYYWKCSQLNTPEPFKCPPDLHFDYVASTCNYIGLANCFLQAEEK